MTTREQLIRDFDTAMHGIYRRALTEAKYNASIFHRMINDHGGYETARRLIHSSAISEGYTQLFLKGRLDLTVEATINDNEQWHPLFTSDELEICKNRLREFQYI